MARIIKKIEIEGKEAIALFDTDAYHTYVKKEFIPEVPKRIVQNHYTVVLGGRIIKVKELCIVFGKIDGLDFDTEAIAVNEIGKADGYELDAIIDVLTMKKWEIKLDSKSGELDLEGLRRCEFTEF